MDGTSKGGIVLTIKDKLGLSVKLIGLGEKLDDLQEFDLDSFIYSLTKDLNGEGLSSKDEQLAIDPKVVADLVRQIKQIQDNGVEVAIVVGGAIQSGFELQGVKARVQSAIRVDGKVAENYVQEKAVKALKDGEVVIFGGGTGRPYFTTDTTATLVACEIKADQILLGKNGVDGIFDSDPKKNPDAKKFDVIT
uniref:UMP kinase n=1 Tax=Biomphalaria glabrata TaxID=6526 RepID=A0A2C9L0V6_BIOGL